MKKLNKRIRTGPSGALKFFGWALPESLQAASVQALKLDRGPGII